MVGKKISLVSLMFESKNNQYLHILLDLSPLMGDIFLVLPSLSKKKKSCFSYIPFYNSFPVLPFLSLLHNSWYFS